MATDTPAPQPRLAALRQHDFRLLWIGQLISATGSQMQIVAVNWQIYVLLKGNSIAVDVLGQHINLDAKALGLGTLGLVRILPIIAFALFGGMIADTQDRRAIM